VRLSCETASAAFELGDKAVPSRLELQPDGISRVGPGLDSTRAPHRSGRAELPHPAPRKEDLLGTEWTQRGRWREQRIVGV